MAKVEQVKKQVDKKKKKAKLTNPRVLIKVSSTFNNTIVNISDYSGNTITISSCGKVGFKGSKKSTAYAATKAGEDAAIRALEIGAKEAEIVVNGTGVGRQAAIKGIRSAGLRITSLSDKTPVQHGGCKPRKAPKK